MIARVVALVALTFLHPAHAGPESNAAALSAIRTVAEETEYSHTAPHADVLRVLDAIAAAAPDRARRASMGSTVEGRDLPLLIVSDPPVATPEEARALAKKEGRVTCFLFANIHAGEVDGKEALPMLARDLLLADPDQLLKQLVVIIAPNYNADGNDRFGPIDINRPGQNGPSAGAGQRHNAMDLDLNRDFVKLESPEARALVRAMNDWDPDIIVDCHTTNGSYHRYPLTFAGPKVPAGDPSLIAFSRDTMFPAITDAMQRDHATDIFIYGDFEGIRTDNPRGHTRWETFPPVARYSTGYIGLRGRLGVLSEAYSYATFKERVWATYHFCSEILQFAATNRERVKQSVRDAKAWGRGTAPGSDTIILRTKPVAGKDKVVVKGWVEEQRNGRTIATQVPMDYECDLMNFSEATLTVKRPAAYAIPSSLTNVIENLHFHGIQTRTLDVEQEVTAETYTINSAVPAATAFQRHNLMTVEATPTRGTVRLPAGTVIVDTNQPLGVLIVYLLEPESEDGLVMWNFLDAHLQPGGAFPVVRIVR